VAEEKPLGTPWRRKKLSSEDVNWDEMAHSGMDDGFGIMFAGFYCLRVTSTEFM
jgi:hypothetical protein